MGFDWIPSKNYKRHYICLNCKKGFKKPAITDVKHAKYTDYSSLMDTYYRASLDRDIIRYIQDAIIKAKVVCPNCGGNMLQVDYNFKVPAQRDIKYWNKLEKSLTAKGKITLNTFIQWHILELQKVAVNTTKQIVLKANLEKLKAYQVKNI